MHPTETFTAGLTAHGGRLAAGQACSCRQSHGLHVHHWQIECQICGYRVVCEGPRTYELPDHLLVGTPLPSLDGTPIDDDDEIHEEDDPAIKRRVPNERMCTGSGFRQTAVLAIWEIA